MSPTPAWPQDATGEALPHDHPTARHAHAMLPGAAGLCCRALPSLSATTLSAEPSAIRLPAGWPSALQAVPVFCRDSTSCLGWKGQDLPGRSADLCGPLPRTPRRDPPSAEERLV